MHVSTKDQALMALMALRLQHSKTLEINENLTNQLKREAKRTRRLELRLEAALVARAA